MTRATRVVGLVGTLLAAGGLSGLPSASLGAPPTAYDGPRAGVCVERPVVGGGSIHLDPDHLGSTDVADADRRLRQAEASARGDTRVTTIVRVHVHVLRDARSGYVPRAQIRRQLTVLNGAYGGRQSSASARSPLTFRLASVDVTVNANWYRMDEGSVAEHHAKRRLHRGGSAALNLYLVNSRSGLLGWATQPTAYREQPLLDGVVVNQRTLPGGSGGRYSAGDVAVHETGHWLGLFHTFTGRCGSRGDLVADTPAEARPSYTCPVGRNTCAAAGIDPVHNFMDYSYDSCMTRFTGGQVQRMNRAWVALRAG